MNKLTSKISARLTPQMAIIVYGYEQSVYLEQRNIENGKMGAGRPLSKDCISQIVKAIAEDNEEMELGYRGVIPKNLLYADTTSGRTKLVWYNPPMKRMMYFTKSLGIPDGEVYVPGILYVAEDRKLRVWSFKGKTPKDKLYIAPYFNVNDENICLGNAKVAKPRHLTFSESMEYWEQMFWKSEFSHILGGNPINGNLAVITKDCIETGKPFPSDVLIPSKHNLKEFLK